MLDLHTGDMIVKQLGIRVQSSIGASDTGLYPILLDDPMDWNIHRFHPDLSGFFLEHFAADLYELCITRQDQDTRSCFTANPESEIYRTKDLWRQVCSAR